MIEQLFFSSSALNQVNQQDRCDDLLKSATKTSSQCSQPFNSSKMTSSIREPVSIRTIAIVGTGSRMDEVIFEELKGTGNMELVLDQHFLADRRSILHRLD